MVVGSWWSLVVGGRWLLLHCFTASTRRREGGRGCRLKSFGEIPPFSHIYELRWIQFSSFRYEKRAVF